MSKSKSATFKRLIMIVGGIVAVVAIAYFSGVSSYLGARLTGPDVSSNYKPLVRHLLASENHCFDEGSLFCEKYLGTGGGKEFTVAYLFGQSPRGLQTKALYGCYASKTQDYVITTDSRDCRAIRAQSYFLGYTATSDAFESSVELFRCYNKSANNYLVTDDSRECELSAHTDSITSLGWAAAAGHLPQRRLQGLCAAVKQANVLPSAYDGYCRNLDPTPTPGLSKPPVVQSWQNPKNRYDVNNDGTVSPIDLLTLVNIFNQRGALDLVAVQEPTPPYIDINGDKHFTYIDISTLRLCFNPGNTSCNK